MADEPQDSASEPSASEEPSPDERHSRLSDLGGYIRNQRNSSQLSLRKLAKLAGVSNPYLSQIERGLRKPSAEILQAIAKALEISSETLYVKAGILEERDDLPDLENAIVRDQHLTDHQRQTLVDMYRSFRQLNEMRSGARDPDNRRGPTDLLKGVLDQITAGDVDDDAVRAASTEDEDPEEA
ncbi:MAG: transcriptional regulator with XRE-family HTH domain [Glaciecola sp.]